MLYVTYGPIRREDLQQLSGRGGVRNPTDMKRLDVMEDHQLTGRVLPYVHNRE